MTTTRIMGSSMPHRTQFAMVLVLCFLAHVVFSFDSQAQRRFYRPLELQLNLSTAISGTIEGILIGSGAQDVDSNHPIPGFDFGMHFSKRLFVGIGAVRRVAMTRRESFGFGEVDDAVANLNYSIPSRQMITIRYSPFRNGLYVSAGLSLSSENEYTMKLSATGERFFIGSNSFTGTRSFAWVTRPKKRAIVGVGYNYIHHNGLSARIGYARVLGSIPLSEDLIVRAVGSGVRGVFVWPENRPIYFEGIDSLTYSSMDVFFVNVGYNFLLRKGE